MSVTNHEETNLNIFENLSGRQEGQVGHDKAVVVGVGTIIELKVHFFGEGLERRSGRSSSRGESLKAPRFAT